MAETQAQRKAHQRYRAKQKQVAIAFNPDMHYLVDYIETLGKSKQGWIMNAIKERYDMEIKAIKKAITEAGFEASEERVKEWMADDTVNIHTARNGRDVAWLILEASEVAMYVDTLEVLSEDEITEQLA